MLSVFIRKLHQNQLSFVFQRDRFKNFIRLSSNSVEEKDQLKMKENINSNEDYFRQFAMNSASFSNKETETLRNERYIEKSKEFAHDVINHPNKPSFSMIQTHKQKQEKNIHNSDDMDPEEIDSKYTHVNELNQESNKIERKKVTRRKKSDKFEDEDSTELEKLVNFKNFVKYLMNTVKKLSAYSVFIGIIEHPKVDF